MPQGSGTSPQPRLGMGFWPGSDVSRCQLSLLVHWHELAKNDSLVGWACPCLMKICEVSAPELKFGMIVFHSASSLL